MLAYMTTIVSALLILLYGNSGVKTNLVKRKTKRLLIQNRQMTPHSCEPVNERIITVR